MKVYLVRHGKALPPEKDPSQPLSNEGRNNIAHLAQTLKNMNIRVLDIVHSGKLRAEETAGIIAGEIEVAGGVRETKTGLAPNDDTAEALEIIETAEDDLMLVSHLPLIANLLEALVKPEDPGALPVFHTGNLVALEKSGDRWHIFRHLGPRMVL